MFWRISAQILSDTTEPSARLTPLGSRLIRGWSAIIAAPGTFTLITHMVHIEELFPHMFALELCFVPTISNLFSQNFRDVSHESSRCASGFIFPHDFLMIPWSDGDVLLIFAIFPWFFGWKNPSPSTASTAQAKDLERLKSRPPVSSGKRMWRSRYFLMSETMRHVFFHIGLPWV